MSNTNHRCGLVQEGATSTHLREALGHESLDLSEIVQRLAEGLALAAVPALHQLDCQCTLAIFFSSRAYHSLDTTSSDPTAHGRETQAFNLQIAHHAPDCAPLTSNQIGRRNADLRWPQDYSLGLAQGSAAQRAAFFFFQRVYESSGGFEPRRRPTRRSWRLAYHICMLLVALSREQ